MSDEPAAKRHKADDDEDCPTDLTVVVEGQSFQVHSLILMMVSPVFRRMLSVDMAEKTNKTVTLHEKKRSEWEVFWKIIQPDVATNLSRDNVEYLSRWADEYQVVNLKARCDAFLIENVPVSVASLHHATRYNLPRRAQQCTTTILGDVMPHLNDLGASCQEMAPKLLQKLWPVLCRASGVATFDMPSSETVITMFPFVITAAKARAVCQNVAAWTTSYEFDRDTRRALTSNLQGLKDSGRWIQ